MWVIETEPSVPDLPLFDHVCFAMGAHIDAGEVDCLKTTYRKFPIEMHGGLPALTDDLKWRDEVPLFLTGKLATLQIGPGAANLEGARLSAERIAWAVDELLDMSGGPLDGMPAEGDDRHRYFAGIGSRYTALQEE